LFLEDILTRYEKFTEEISREHYLVGAGLKDTPEYHKIYEKYSDLFSLDTVSKVIKEKSNLHEDAPYEEYEGYDRVIFTLLGLYLERSVIKEYEELQKREISSTVEYKGKVIPFRMVRNILSTENSRENRRELYQKTIPIVEDLTEYKINLAQRMLNIIRREFGYPNFVSYDEARMRVDIRRYSKDLERFLKDTEEEYRKLADYVFGKFLNLGWGEVQSYDIAYLMSGIIFKDFKVDDPIKVLRQTLNMMNLNLDEMKNLTIDDEIRANKSPRAFCVPIRIPDEVVVVVKPSGYFEDISTLFHEMGHALHFAHTSKDLPVVYRLMGRVGTSEIFAFNFQYISDSVGWLSRFFNVSDDFIKYRRFVYLYLRRRYAAKVIYESELLSKDDWKSIGQELYHRILTEATGVVHPPHNYFWDLDFGFYSVEYSQAWEVEEILRNRLISEFGEDWYFNKESGEYLKTLWSLGMRYDPQKLAAKL